MNTTDYELALRTAKHELGEAVAELGEAQARTQELENRIGDLRQTVSVLSKLCGEEDVDLETSLGLTDAIRLAFVSLGQNQPIIAQEMRLHLENRGFNTRRYGNLLASIHTVFSRLEKQGEIRMVGTRADGKPAYTITQTGQAKATVVSVGKVVADWLLPNAVPDAPAGAAPKKGWLPPLPKK